MKEIVAEDLTVFIEPSTGKEALYSIVGGFHDVHSTENRYKSLMSVE